jgi:hypothetical protein
MLKSSNTLISVSEIERCLIIAGLYSVKGKQDDDSYKVFIQKLIDKVCALDNR